MDSAIKVVAGIILKNNTLLLAKRPIDKHQGGLWEFPGGKVERGETNENALIRECLEELGIKIFSPQYFDKVDFDYSDKKVSISFYTISNFSGKAKGNEGQEITWVNQAELKKKLFPEANKLIVDKLIKNNFSLFRVKQSKK
ncbi:MAG: 8-oxo-dGTP diphosphatase [Polaribacter sp.]|jgi:8-oxo-dGTP diphosphatase